jgi:hypothetical protein
MDLARAVLPAPAPLSVYRDRQRQQFFEARLVGQLEAMMDGMREAEPEYYATLMLQGSAVEDQCSEDQRSTLARGVRIHRRLSICVVAAGLLALVACGSSTSPPPVPGPTIQFDQAHYDDVLSTTTHQIVQFQPSRIILKRGVFPFPSTVKIQTQPSVGCLTGDILPTFADSVDQVANVSFTADSLVFTQSYELCPPYTAGSQTITASYTQDGSTVSARATVTVTAQ